MSLLPFPWLYLSLFHSLSLPLPLLCSFLSYQDCLCQRDSNFNVLQTSPPPRGVASATEIFEVYVKLLELSEVVPNDECMYKNSEQQASEDRRGRQNWIKNSVKTRIMIVVYLYLLCRQAYMLEYHHLDAARRSPSP